MTLLQFVTYLTQVIYIVIGLITVKDYLADRNQTRLNITLLASSIGLSIGLSRVIEFVPELEFLRPVATTMLVAFPYLLIRVVHMFHPVPPYIHWTALVSFLISTVFLWLYPDSSSLPTYALLFIVAYFALAQFYAAFVFIWGSVAKQGLSRRRFMLAAFGSAFLGGAIIGSVAKNS